MFERELRDLAFVPRWVIARTIRTQSVAEHSFFVAVYTAQLCELLELSKEETLNSVILALTHDWEECFTGDIPGPVKKSTFDKTKFNTYISRGVSLRFDFSYRYGKNAVYDKIVKTANLIDEVLYLCGERQLGNQSIEQFYNNSIRRLRISWNELPWPEPNMRSKKWELIDLAINKELVKHSELPEGSTQL